VKYSYFACKVQYHVAFLTSRVDKTLLSAIRLDGVRAGTELFARRDTLTAIKGSRFEGNNQEH